jgi:hypothetical protein
VGPIGLCAISAIFVIVLWLSACLISEDLSRIAPRLQEIERDINDDVGRSRPYLGNAPESMGEICGARKADADALALVPKILWMTFRNLASKTASP